MRLQDRHCLVTGAAGDIGGATVRRMLDEGARVSMLDIAFPAGRLAGLPAERTVQLLCDMTDEAAVEASAAAAVARFGPVHVFFNNAGIEGEMAPLPAFDRSEFDRVMQVNVTGVFLGLKHVMPVMADGGSVIVTSSTAGLKGSANTAAYVASKHAALGLARVAAVEGAARRIRVNAIHPTAVRGRMIRQITDDLDRRGGTQPAIERIASGILLGRLVEPDDVAATVIYLASDDSRMVTGTSIVVDGGAR
ncbi:MAG: SDR family oxidoreductase [Rhizobiaceae bacterium]|nr:SDR family oxidoreductase [Rhizobiaceae bacterium]